MICLKSFQYINFKKEYTYSIVDSLLCIKIPGKFNKSIYSVEQKHFGCTLELKHA